MAIHHKAIPSVDVQLDKPSANPHVEAPRRPLDDRLRRVQALVQQQKYSQAIEMLPGNGNDLEIRNCRAVCLMRLNHDAQAYDLLRTVVLNGATQHVRADVANHVKVNFATALFYGGLAQGALDVLDDIQLESDPGVIELRQAIAHWVAEMSFFRRLDWKINRIAPKQLPVKPSSPVGRFVWDVT